MPTQKFRNAQTEEIAKQQKTVSALWKELYDRQTAAVLKWPSNLSDEFREHIEKLNFGDDIPPNLRAHYNNYIRDHFPELPKIVGAALMPDTGQGGMGGGMGRGGGGGVSTCRASWRAGADARAVAAARKGPAAN